MVLGILFSFVQDKNLNDSAREVRIQTNENDHMVMNCRNCFLVFGNNTLTVLNSFRKHNIRHEPNFLKHILLVSEKT